MNSFHVLHAVEGLERSLGGPAISSTRLAGAINRLDDFRCTIAAPKSEEAKVAIDSKLQIIDVPENKSILDDAVADSLRDLHRDQKIDLIHIHGIWKPFLHQTCRFCRREKIQYVVAPRGMLEPWSLRQKWLKKKFAWWLYQHHDLKAADRIHVTAENERQSLQNLGFDDLSMVPNGVEIPDLPERNEADDKIALFLSRIHPKKGIDILLPAWKNAVDDFDDWVLKIVGPGDEHYIRSLRHKIEQLGIQGGVEILPPAYESRKWQLYRDADLFVLPTHSENFGIVVAEAMAMETAVITTTGTPWTKLDTIGAGWCIELNPQNLESILRTALSTDLENLRNMGVRGREYVVDRFSWDRIANEMADVYRSILSVANV